MTKLWKVKCSLQLAWHGSWEHQHHSGLLQEQFHYSFEDYCNLIDDDDNDKLSWEFGTPPLEAWATLVNEAGNRRRLAFLISRVEEGRREISEIGIHQPTNSRGDVNTWVTVHLFVGQIEWHLDRPRIKKLIIGPPCFVGSAKNCHEAEITNRNRVGIRRKLSRSANHC